MITAIRGILEGKGAGLVKVRVGGGITIQVFVPTSTVDGLGEAGGEVQLHTRLYFKDDEPVLYGFSTPEALGLFQLLNGVSGVGPRTSLSVLSAMSPQSLIAAIATGDVDALTAVPGVGKKAAGRLVLELKGKLETELAELPARTTGGEDGEVVPALMALGYTATEARRVLASMGTVDGLPLEEKVRRALQELSG